MLINATFYVAILCYITYMHNALKHIPTKLKKCGHKIINL